jgi:carbohydrate-selective porin OprB
MMSRSRLYKTMSRARKCGLSLCAIAVFMFAGLIQPNPTCAGYLDDALEAGELGVSYFQVAWTGLYQRSLSEGAEAGPYDFDLIGSAILGRGTDSNVFGDTDLVFWLFSVDNMGGFGSTSELSRKSGLLWDTNDIAVSSSVTQFGAIGLRQFLFDDRFELGMGKLFPGLIHNESPYTANNSETFMTKLVSASAVSRYFEAIGLGANVKYSGPGWFAQAGFTDVKGVEEFDFSSFADGVFSWTGEIGWAPERTEGTTVVSLLGFIVDETSALSRETGFAIAATHELGEDQGYGLFGRYTVRDGGEGLTPADREQEQRLSSGGFVGLALNAPFGQVNDQLAFAVLHGTATDYQGSLGFDNQYGLEAYWKYSVAQGVALTPSLQLLKNSDGDLETVIGLRLKLQRDFTAP